MEDNEKCSTCLIFVQLKLCFNNEKIEKDFEEGSIKSFTLKSDMTYKSIKKMLRESFGLVDSSIVIKLRNKRGFLVPFYNKLESTTPDNPYLLEACKLYQNVLPLKRTASIITYEEVLKKKILLIDKRLSKLEMGVPTLPERQRLRIEESYNDLVEKMKVLDRKLEVASDIKWQGMFHRNPLW
ncbi:uncharacterized protein LOC100207626 isoform X2 [Hydra vulgaris]|uniref:Uncharacterized protein LOC100207626 isoform X2 n=1 Tax=Hydra vulgaris TaxID=6087 RepID=A0ABM4CZ28_HYDVU